jgi:Acyltransferase family
MPTPEKVRLPNAGAAATSGGRYAFIDVLRGVAALLVIFQHGGEGAGWFSIATGFGPWVNFGQVGVLTFFLVSGFVIPLSLERANALGRFWKHRIFRLDPLYLAIFTLELALYLAGYGPFPPGAVHNLGYLLLSHLFFLQEYARTQLRQRVVDALPGVCLVHPVVIRVRCAGESKQCPAGFTHGSGDAGIIRGIVCSAHTDTAWPLRHHGDLRRHSPSRR